MICQRPVGRRKGLNELIMAIRQDIRRRILAGLAVLLLGGGVWAWLRMDQGPTYQGRGMAYWFNDPHWMQGPAVAAFRSFGSDAVPFLVTEARRSDSVPAEVYRRRWRNLPVWLRWRLPLPKLANERRDHALTLLAILGPEARSGVPELIAACADTYRQRHHLPAGQPLNWPGLFTNTPMVAASEKAGGMGMVITNRAGVVMVAEGLNTPADHLWQLELSALAKIGGDDPGLLAVLLVGLREAPGRTQGVIAKELRNCPTSAAAVRATAPLLLAALHDPQPEIRVAAAGQLLVLQRGGAGWVDLVARSWAYLPRADASPGAASPGEGIPVLKRLLADIEETDVEKEKYRELGQTLLESLRSLGSGKVGVAAPETEK